MYGALAKNMLSKGLSQRPMIPFPKMNYKSLVKKVLSFKSPEWSSCRSRCHIYSHSSFLDLFRDLNDSIEGLDIQPHFTS